MTHWRDMEMLDAIFDAAQEHGAADDPEHEVGDLQQALQLAWHWLNPLQREDVHRKFMELQGDDYTRHRTMLSGDGGEG